MGLKCEFLFRAEPNLGFSRNYFLTLTHWGQRRKLVNSPKTSEIQDWCIRESFLCSIKQLWEWLSLCLCSNNLENFYFNFLPEFLTKLLFMLHWYICCSTFQSSSITSNVCSPKSDWKYVFNVTGDQVAFFLRNDWILNLISTSCKIERTVVADD